MSSPQTGPESQERAGTTEPTTPEQQKQWATTMAPTQAIMPGSGWLAFAGSMLLLVGIFNIIGGFAAMFRPDYYLVSDNELLVFNFGAWGWVWLVLGVVQAATGIGCLYGNEWARMTGVALAALSAIGHLAFLAAYPLWSLLVIALSVLVIYGLMVPQKGSAA